MTVMTIKNATARRSERRLICACEGNNVKYKLTIGALTMSAALAAVPAVAQTSEAHSATTAPASGYVANTSNTMPDDRNPVMTKMGDARASKVIGSTVYNNHNEKVGSIDDLLIRKDGRTSVVLSVGGFLGMDTKYVEVPYANLTFGSTHKDSDNRVVLKGATKESLKSQAAYSYYKG